ncbi:DMT family transporter [Acidithiobacillus ferrianus]|uniref:DMT family transporter n=1 Tax=Acidithiobacillus ferrianus TaxID=2678518 RepID=A0ACD5H4M3_9PROT|nr:DMT family transporter [Acidithiobacillus ferrianus]
MPIIALLVGSSLWGVLWWPLRYFDAAGLRGAWLIFAIYLLLALPAGVWSWRRRCELRRHGGSLVGLFLLGGWTNVAFMLALVHGEVIRVLLLFYLSPVWAIFAARIFLREAIGWRGALAVSLAVGGAVLVVSHGQGFSFADLDMDDLLAMSSGLAFALSNVVLRADTVLGDLHRATAVWWGCALIALPFALFQPVPVLPLPEYGGLLAFSWLWIAGATVAVQFGVARMPVGTSAVIMPFEVIVGALSAWWLAGEMPTLLEWFGGVLILAAALLQITRNRGRPISLEEGRC